MESFDLAPLMEVLMGGLATVLSVLISYGVYRLVGFLGIKEDSTLAVNIDRAAQAAVAYGVRQMQYRYTEGMNPEDVEEDIINEAAEYLVRQMPKALTKLQMDLSNVQDLVRSRLAERLGLPEAYLDDDDDEEDGSLVASPA